jgi:hypothetical protein
VLQPQYNVRAAAAVQLVVVVVAVFIGFSWFGVAPCTVRICCSAGSRRSMISYSCTCAYHAGQLANGLE